MRKKEKIKRLLLVKKEILLAALGTVAALASVVDRISDSFSPKADEAIAVPIVLAMIVLFGNAVLTWSLIQKLPNYELTRKKEEFSLDTLKALKEADQAKTRVILQSTYGNVPQWHPIDYTKNILVYDVHEQIRTILLQLREAVIKNVEGLTDDHITVDLVYCYPDEIYTGVLPYTPYACGKTDDKTWRLITSGNHSLGGSMKSYLGRHDSFYCHVDQIGYVFYNDKTEISNAHYIPSNKDKEHKDYGSIIGLEIELRNDVPETVFIKGILTITTYGQKIYDNEKITKEDFEIALKENLLNNFRSLILSELAQMYIRHSIRGKTMCPITGKKLKLDKSVFKHCCDNCQIGIGENVSTCEISECQELEKCTFCSKNI